MVTPTAQIYLIAIDALVERDNLGEALCHFQAAQKSNFTLIKRMSNKKEKGHEY
jgi:hypothetical protein